MISLFLFIAIPALRIFAYKKPPCGTGSILSHTEVIAYRSVCNLQAAVITAALPCVITAVR